MSLNEDAMVNVGEEREREEDKEAIRKLGNVGDEVSFRSCRCFPKLFRGDDSISSSFLALISLGESF